MLLKVEKLNIFRGFVHANVDISFEVERGEIVGIVGPNGAGKTTLLQGLMGLIPVQSGHVYYDNMEITNFPPHKIAKLGIGYVPEDRKLFGELTVRENILLPCWSKKIALKEEELNFLDEIFPEVKKLYNKRSLYCSGGEQMMIAILRAISSKPKLLLLDECFEGLAPVARKRLKEYLVKEKGSNLTAILTESNINYLTWVDKLYYIERGQLTPMNITQT